MFQKVYIEKGDPNQPVIMCRSDQGNGCMQLIIQCMLPLYNTMFWGP